MSQVEKNAYNLKCFAIHRQIQEAWRLYSLVWLYCFVASPLSFLLSFIETVCTLASWAGKSWLYKVVKSKSKIAKVISWQSLPCSSYSVVGLFLELVLGRMQTDLTNSDEWPARNYTLQLKCTTVGSWASEQQADCCSCPERVGLPVLRLHVAAPRTSTDERSSWFTEKMLPLFTSNLIWQRHISVKACFRGSWIFTTKNREESL